MISRNLYIICIVFPVSALCLSEEGKQYILKTAERRILLNWEYETYWNDIVEKKDSQWLESSDSEIELEAISTKRFLSALDDRVSAIRLNVKCWRCAWYFKEKVFSWLDQKDENKAKQCANVEDTMTWYNGRFSAEMFFEAYRKGLQKKTASVNLASNSEVLSSSTSEFSLPHEVQPSSPKTSISESPLMKKVDAMFGIEIKKSSVYSDDKERLDIQEFVLKIDRVLNKLKIMNEIFITANLNYEDIFQKLKGKCDYLEQRDSPEKGPLFDFHKDIDSTLWDFLGTDYSDINKYMESFLSRKFVRQEFKKKAIAEYKYIQDAKEIGKKYSQVMNIIRLENQLLYAPVEALKIEIPSQVAEKTWRVQRKEHGMSEFIFVLD